MVCDELQNFATHYIIGQKRSPGIPPGLKLGMRKMVAPPPTTEPGSAEGKPWGDRRAGVSYLIRSILKKKPRPLGGRGGSLRPFGRTGDDNPTALRCETHVHLSIVRFFAK